MTTAVDLVNNALEYISAQNTITSFTDGSAEADAAALIYQPQVALLLRQFDWGFARREAALSATDNAPPFPWAVEWLYPSDGIMVRSLYPSSSTISIYDPQPFRWAEGTNQADVPTKVLWGSLALPATAVYTWNAVGFETEWDSSFTETVTCKIASVFAMTIAGRPDLHKQFLEEAEMWAQAGANQEY